MRRKLIFLIITFFFLFGLTTCGIDDLFYLPPVTTVYIELTEYAEITLPYLSSSFYYVTNFAIFYRIYLSDTNSSVTLDTADRMRTVNTQLESDFNYFNNVFINPINAQVPTITSFTNRNYFQLWTINPLVLETSSGVPSRNIHINFEAGQPATITDPNVPVTPTFDLLRNNSFSIKPDTDNRFLHNPLLLYYDDSTGPGKTHNLDVIAGEKGQGQYEYAYISLYIVTEGTQSFQPLYSKPKHIGVFKLSPII